MYKYKKHYILIPWYLTYNLIQVSFRSLFMSKYTLFSIYETKSFSKYINQYFWYIKTSYNMSINTPIVYHHLRIEKYVHNLTINRNLKGKESIGSEEQESQKS